jgi:hypothetical protein
MQARVVTPATSNSKDDSMTTCNVQEWKQQQERQSSTDVKAETLAKVVKQTIQLLGDSILL